LTARFIFLLSSINF